MYLLAAISSDVEVFICSYSASREGGHSRTNNSLFMVRETEGGGAVQGGRQSDRRPYVNRGESGLS